MLFCAFCVEACAVLSTAILKNVQLMFLILCVSRGIQSQLLRTLGAHDNRRVYRKVNGWAISWRWD
jgi:hypothetical protein